jgi:hypothetical protein
VGTSSESSGCDPAGHPLAGRGELLHWHPHIHTLATCGAFTLDGEFLELPELDLERLQTPWQKAVFALAPLICPRCSGQMKIVAFMEPPQGDVIEKILRGHRRAAMVRDRSNIGWWEPALLRPLGI